MPVQWPVTVTMPVQWPTGKAVYSRCYRTLVGEEPRDATLVFCSRSPDER